MTTKLFGAIYYYINTSVTNITINVQEKIRVTRLGEISPFGQFFMAKFFLEKNAK